MFNIVKALFWFVIGTVATLVFAGIMLFIFGQSDRLTCRHDDGPLASCTVTHVLLGAVPLPGWQATGVSQAIVAQSCDSDGCTYRTELRTQGGTRRAISEVWTDQHSEDEALASKINDFLADSAAPTLVIEQQPQAWVLWLLGGLSLMAIVIQGFVLLGQIVRPLLRVGQYS